MAKPPAKIDFSGARTRPSKWRGACQCHGSNALRIILLENLHKHHILVVWPMHTRYRIFSSEGTCRKRLAAALPGGGALRESTGAVLCVITKSVVKILRRCGRGYVPYS